MSVEEQSAAAPLRVGIDLGTSRSAISSSSGGQFVVDSFVGWPADLVARKVLKRDLVIGRDALDNRTMLDLHRPLERGLIKEGSERDLQAARELLRHLLSLVAPKNGKNRPVRAVVGVPAAAMRTNKQYLRNALKGVVDSLMIVSEPFAVAYGLNALVHTMIIDIGAGTTDFCVMKGRYPTDEDQRSLTRRRRFDRRPPAQGHPGEVPESERHPVHGARVEGTAQFCGRAAGAGHRLGSDRRRADRARHHQRNARGVRVDRAADRRNDDVAAVAGRSRVPAHAFATTSRWPAAAR